MRLSKASVGHGTPAQAREVASAWVIGTLLCVLYALNVALFPFAALIADSGRDLANGLAIAQGAAWPMYGPGLFGTWQLGPAWYLLLALPLWLGGSVGGAALTVGLLAALKVPLAYVLGRDLAAHDAIAGDPRGHASALAPARDRSLGLLCAAAIALPGWHTLGSMVLSHTALVEALLLATLLASLRAVRRHSPWLAVLASLLLALGLHAHPTVLIAAPAVAAAWWLGVPRRRLWWLALMALVFLLPFASALLAEARAGWPQWAGSGAYLGGSAFGRRLLRAPQVLMGAGWHGSVFVREFLLLRVPGLGGLWQAGVLLGWVAAVTGSVLALTRRDVRPAAVLLAWVLGAVFVGLLRDTTPAWMTYALWPLQALAWSLGAHAVLRTSRQRMLLATGAAVVAAVLGATLLGDRMALRREGLQALPGTSIGDVAVPVLPESATRAWLAGFDHDRVTQRLCSTQPPTVLHGDLAAAIDFGQGVAAALHCTTPLQLGGNDPAAAHRAGLPRTVADALALEGEALAGFVLLPPARVMHPQTGRIAAPDTAYRASSFAALAAQGEQTLQLQVECSVGELLVITNRLPDLNPLQLTARTHQVLLTPRLQQFASLYYDCDDAPIALDIRTLDAGAVDVFVLPP